MAGFNPSEPRVDAGSAAGGQWGGAAKASSKRKAPAKPSTTSHKPGAPRNAAAAKAQADPQAQAMYARLLDTPTGKRAEYLHGLSDGDLEALTAIAYSSRTSDPAVVRARIAVANEMAKRGIDVKAHGALGGGASSAPARKAASAPVRRPAPAATKRPAPTPARRPAPTPAQQRVVASRTQGTAGTGQKRAI